MQSPTLNQYAMNAGEGRHSYVKNSIYQRGAVDVAKSIIEDEIAKNLYVSSINSFHIADFGCATGHNSFLAIKIITQAITRQISELASHDHEFLVYFNDNMANDFNTLFRSLPKNNYYNALGLPGDFHGRLLPKSSLHFAYCSWSLHWLTEVPTMALNKGAAMYSGNRKKDDQVYDAYLCQFGKDLGSFLDARAQELMNGGLMALLIPTVPSFCDPQTEYTLTCYLNLMGSCLTDMAKKGIIDETKVDAFNPPLYFATPEELKTIIDNNNNYSIERFEVLYNPGKQSLPSTVRERVAFFRAVIEKLIGDHFGSEIINEFFDLYTKKFAASSVLVNSDNDKTHVTLVILKRKAN